MRIDAAAYLGAWPYRAGIKGTPADLTMALHDAEAGGALVSPLEAFFQADTMPANEALLWQLYGRHNLWAAPVINPRMPDAVASVAHLAESPQVRAIRLTPSFHGYAVERAREVAQAAAEHGLAVIVQLRMQDERSHPVAFQLPPVPLAEAIDFAAAAPQARVVIAAARMGEMENKEAAARIREQRGLWLDISHIDGLGCVRRACKAIGAGKLLVATSWPFFYARSAALKVAEAQLPARDLEALTGGNAARVLRVEPARGGKVES